MDCPEENELVDFLRGELDDESRDAVEAHIDGCDICREVVVELARFEPASGELAVTDQSIDPEPVGHPTKDPERETYKVAPRLTEGDKVGRYVVLTKVGEGGMGVVYSAYDPELDRKVAIKLLMTSLGGSLDAELAEQRTRLLREAQAMAKLKHPNVITVHDVGEFGDQVFVAMEFVDGGTLTKWQETHRSWRERLAIVLDAGRGLAAAHRAGLVHRDFKPDNVLIDKEGRAAVTDFGLARPAAGRTDAFNTVEVMESTPVMSAQLTRTGALVGTPAYMAPEQLAGERSDALGDQFSFCVTVYEALYGKRPFEGRVLGELMANVSAGRVLPPPRDVDVPRRVRRALLRGLSVEPDDRFPTMEALIAELSHDPSRTWKRWATIILPSSVLGVGLLAYQQAETTENKFCADLDAHLLGIWDPERQQSLEQVFLGTGLGYAASTWESTQQALDDHVSQWVTAQRTACEQSASGEVPPAVMALRMQCLEAQRRQLGTLVGVLHNIDEDGLKRARDAVDSLSSPDRCQDVEALARRDAALDTPERQAVRDKLDDINTKAFALQRTGQLPDSAKAATEALELARAESETWSEAEALITLAECREFEGRLEESEELQHQAMSAAISSGHDAVIVRVSIGRVWSGSDPGSDMQEAERWYRNGLAALDRTGGRADHRNQLENGMAAAYMSHEQFEEAEKHAENALAARDPENPLSSLGQDSTWATLGRLYVVQGRMDDARDAFDRSLELTRERYGPMHPFMAAGLENLGALYGQLSDYERAREALARALEVRRVSLGDDHPGNANTLTNLSNIDNHLGDYEAARSKLTEALRIVRKSQPGSTNEADVLMRLGNLHRDFGHPADAEEALTAALEIIDDMEGMPPIVRLLYLASMGETLVAAGKFEDARTLLEDALELVANESSQNPRVARTRLLWATSFPSGVPADRRKEVEDAGNVLVSTSTPLQAAEALWMLARITWAHGDQRGAWQHASAARTLLEPLGPSAIRQLDQLASWERDHPKG
jgi:serine/threonine protein kinase/tetratricopeptide (TPR) repeat protein